MYTDKFRFKTGVSSFQILLAWTVLLKDYIGSSGVSFSFSDSTQCHKGTGKIDLELDEHDTIGLLSRRIKEQLLVKSDSNEYLSFKTHLDISSGEPENLNGHLIGSTNGHKKQWENDSADDKRGQHPREIVDWTIKCVLSEDGRGMKTTAIPKLSTASSRQGLRLMYQLEHVLRHIHLSTEGTLVYKIDTATKSDLNDIWKWNFNNPPLSERTVLEIFTENVQRYPTATAVNAWDGDLSYQELDRLSTEFSFHLAYAGVKRGNIVPLFFEKSMWTPVAIWAVIKTGAAFVLLDEVLPESRLQQLGQVIRQEIIVALASSSQESRAKLLGTQVIIIDSYYLETAASVPSEFKTQPQIQPSDLIYIVFTSGTTGVPKAVMIQHSNVSAFARSLRTISDVGPNSRIVALSSYAFDVSLGNLFLSLLSGCCLCIPSSWECRNTVPRVLQDYQITHAQMTPSISKMLRPCQLSTLEVLELSGEQCTEDVLARWQETPIRVMNTYSPAECTITTVGNGNVLTSSKSSIIGKGLGNCCWVLDPIDHDRLSPVGGIGELVLEGPSVGMGYLHDPRATALKFFEDPEWLLKGLPGVSPGRKGRLYRTGDLVRYTEDGSIDFVGRRDTQVKIRGQRVELGEISAHLQQLVHPSIWCSPEVVKVSSGTELLVVFLVVTEDEVGNGTASILRSTLRVTVDLVDSELRSRLPPAMVPGAYACIKDIPLTLTGKTDHRKLREIGLSLAADMLIFPSNKQESYATNGDRQNRGLHTTLNGNGYQEQNGHAHTHAHTNGDTNGHTNGYVNGSHSHTNSRNKTQKYGHVTYDGTEEEYKIQTLKEIWSDEFHVDIESITLSDSFFAHGGESLTAIKMVGVAFEKGIQLDVPTIFRHPQLSDLVSNCKMSATASPDHPKPFSLLEGEIIPVEAVEACGTCLDNIEDVYPCTPLQEGLITASISKSTAYVGQKAFLLPDGINFERLALAWQRVVQTHQILRTRIFDTESHGLLQAVLTDGKVFLGIQKRDLKSYLEDDNDRKMGLGTELCRCAIVRESGCSYFVLTMHHAIYDGWTLPRIGSEVFKAYQGVRVEPNMGFNAFIKHIKSLPSQTANKFWAHQLANPGESAVFPIVPLYIQEPKSDSTVSKRFPVPQNANSGVSMPSLLRSAWALLVSKLSDSNDVTFGATVSGRNVPIYGIKDLLSPTISTVPVRVKIDKDSNIETFIATVQDDSLSAIPFENFGLQNIRKINTDTREGSKFQTLFVVHPPNSTTPDQTLNLSLADHELKDILENLDISSVLSNFNEYGLMVIVTQEQDSLIVQASYDSRVLETDQVILLLDQFAHVAEQIGQPANLACKVQELQFASGKDVETIWTWNSTRVPGLKECIHDVICRTIAVQPHGQAISAWDGNLTFEELNVLSLRLAHILRSKGVGRGSLVPICMEKSKWATIAMLGILRIGAGFIAMDVRHQPRQRLQTIADAVNSKWIVTAGPATELVPDVSEGVIVCDQDLQIETSDFPVPLEPVCSASSDTAFVVFTSGTTGVPKGIVITHENFCSTIQHHAHQLKISKESRIYDYASYSFDIAVHNSLMAMCLGACLCIPSEDERENDIEGSFERLQANWTDITPSVARLVDPTGVPGLKTLVLSGEAVRKDLVERWATKVNLINAYGPAECQICTIQENIIDPQQAAHIGRAVGCTAWIIDPENDSLCPIGAVGELVIEGPIVSPGYLNATRDAFIQDPKWLIEGSASIPGRRGSVYRTGDLCRFRPDGTIIYISRATTQIKINGQRIELEDVEFYVQQAMATPGQVIASVVNFDGVNHLTAFLAPVPTLKTNDKFHGLGKDVEPTVELIPPPIGLQNKLKDALPAYMIPTVFLKISHIPLTTTRKIDRRQLNDCASRISRDDLIALDQEGTGPVKIELSEKQENMARLWAQVLKLNSSKIGLHSDFFRLGGESISAMRLVKYARKEGLVLTVADIFRHSRFDQLVMIATELTSRENTAEYFNGKLQPFALVPMNHRDSLISTAAMACNLPSDDIIDIYACTPFQEGVFALTASNSSAYVQHTELRFSDELNLDQVLDAWVSVIAANPILRTRFIQSEDAKLMQVVVRPQKQAWKWYYSPQEYLSEAENIPFGLGDPLFCFGLVRHGSTSSPGHTLIWTLHHAVYDAWTMDLILRQVSSCYYGEKQAESGPDYSVFVDFLRHQESESANWWKSYLSGSSDASIFPKMPISAAESQIDNTIRKEFAMPNIVPPGYSPAVILRAAWAAAVARYTGDESVLFGETRLGRNVPVSGIDKLLGPTIASVPLLVHIDREQTIGSLLYAIREDGLQMQPFEHLGLQNISHISEDTKAACKFQTLLVFLENAEDVDSSSIFKIDETIDDIRNFNSYYLLVYFTLNQKGLVAQAVFKDSAISSGQVEFLLEQVQSIFSKLCESPLDTPLRSLDLASEQDLAKIWNWNATSAEAVDKFVHELIAEKARQHPNKLAVFAHDGQITYKELDDYSTNLASQLIGRGIGLGCFVPLCFEKSAMVPVCMLAVIKTGAAFYVMDVSYPEGRLKLITETLKASLMLASPSQQWLAKRLAGNILVVDSVCCTDNTYRSSHPVIEDPSRNTNRLMYVCFTSGSTGLPKGVMVTHKNISSAAVAQTQDLDFDPEDRVYDFSSHAFDANIWHFYLGFIVGACVCIPSQEDRIGNLAGSITFFQSTALFLTPSVARTLDPKELPTVKRLYLGGEAVTPLDVSKWVEHLDLWGAYGPTETTPLCIFTRLHSPEFASNIGKGVGVRSWICNPNNNEELMAIGAVGEMVNEGPLVTQGYYEQPEKTAKVFIENPEFLLRGYKEIPGRRGRLYRTGDLVRYAFDGSIEYLGRADTQVKLRGQRVEFGEIEYHLNNALPGTSSICEVIIHPSSRMPMLAAFCTLSSSMDTLNETGARAYLCKRVPPYMVPEFFFTIPEIPKNPSGKVDRLKLRSFGPQVLLERSTSHEEGSVTERVHGPLTEMETTLAELWATAVDHDVTWLGMESEFADVGGDSIAAMKLSNLARRHELSLTVKDIINSSNLAGMAIKIQPIHESFASPQPFSLLPPSRIDQTVARAAMTCGVSIDSITDIYPCTPLQVELFSLTMKQPQAYIKRSVFEVPTSVNFEKLIESWDSVFDINAILRTRFVEVDDLGLLQVVIKGHQRKKYGSLDSFIQACSQERLDFGSPLSHLAVVEDSVALKIAWTIHHALYDEWSTLIIEEQLRQAYRSRCIPRPPDYSEFVRYIRTNNHEEARGFWRNSLAGCISAKIYPELPVGNYQVRPRKAFKRSLQYSARPGVNIQATIHAAWALIVSRLSASDDVVFSTTLAGRNAPVAGIEQMVGPTITPVPIRVKLGNQKQSVQSMLDMIEKDIAKMAPYQHIGTKNIERINDDTRAACKFRTLIVVTPTSYSTTHELQDIKTETYGVNSEEGQAFHTIPLVLFFFPGESGLDLEIVFDPVILHEREIERLTGRLETVLSAFSTANSVSDIQCIGREDLEDVWKWNAILPSSSKKLLHEDILECVQRAPDKVAIEAWDCKITYSQLDQLSENHAVHLNNYNVRKGTVVPILSLKSGLVPVAALAVLRAGGTLLPLDITQPVQRLKMIIDQVKPNVVMAGLSSIGIASQLCENVIVIKSCVDITPCAHGDAVYFETPSPDDVACILFTSGSTGIPKGVKQTHRGLSSAIKHQARESGFNENTRAFEFASYGFDVSWNMIFKVLAVGGTLCVPEEEERQNDLARALNRTAATLTELTPSVARLINPQQLTSLTTLILSGESVDPREFAHWKPQNHHQLMPVGAIGEIIIEGPIVGSGYYNNENLTSASYVHDVPWLRNDHDGNDARTSRVFKSGDLARFDSKGNIHFIARKDLQVKLNGQRIELEEVQHHVRNLMHDFVGPVISCVLGDSKQRSDQKLATFLVNKHGNTQGTCLAVPEEKAVEQLETLDERLREMLPKYMVPSIYYFVTAVPRTNNGKIDMKRLVEVAAMARPDQIYRGRTDRQRVRRIPSTPTEMKMQQLWAAALEVPIAEIGADDTFFNLNGDSISAMKLVAGARSEGFDLRVSDVFETPRLSELATKIAPRITKKQLAVSTIRPFELLGESANIVAIRSEVAAKCGMQDPGAVKDVYPCTPLQESMLAATIRDPRAFISMRVYRIRQGVDLVRLENAWATVVAQHPILRTRLVDLEHHGLTQAIFEESHIIWQTYVDMDSFLRHYEEQKMGPTTTLTRWALIDEADDWKLVWTIHHAIYDGWVLPIVEEEVRKTYFGSEQDKQYLDMKPLVKYILQEEKAKSIDFWARLLAGSEESIVYPPLPSHKYESSPATYLERTISADLSSSRGINLSALLYGSWSVLVSHMTGIPKVSFGAILTGRNAPVDGIDRMIGPAVTTVPILVDANPSFSVRKFMDRLQDMTVQRMPHEHLGVHAIRRINDACEAGCRFQTVLVIQPPGGNGHDTSNIQDSFLMEEVDETTIEGFPDQHSVLNQYGLMIEILPRGKEIKVRASFDSNLISTSQLSKTISRWERIINQISQTLSQGVHTTIQSLDSLSQQDIEEIWTWNKELPDVVDDRFVFEIIQEIAGRHPDALAIDAWDGQLTYRDLESLSTRVSELLVSFGVGPGSFVPLLFHKSMWTNVSMLGVLKVGAAFVPLDFSHPEGHLRAVMQPLNADIILCADNTRDRAARLSRRAIIVDERSLNADHGNNLATDIPNASVSHTGNAALHIDDLAYAVFTSGSTGAAKGVKVSHKNLVTAIHHHCKPERFQIGLNTRSLDSSSYSFDACIFNFFYTVTQGGCLCVPNDEALKGDIGAFMRQYKVNWAQLVPSVARTLNPKVLPDLKDLILTGEPLTRTDIETWCHNVRLFNVYGPTECTILCSISSPIKGSSHFGYIGRGQGANIWLTEIGNPDKLVPIGVPGEILIEGPIIGAGYLGPYQYPLVEDPPWLLAGTGHISGRQGKLFRTGDQALYTDDGTLVFIGRIGTDIKLRGQRVDIVAVEDIIRRHVPSGLEIAVGIARITVGGKVLAREMLLCFASQNQTFRDNGASPQNKLNDILRALVADIIPELDAAMPKYLHPEAFVALSSMPKTSSGKTDRRCLKEAEKQLRLHDLIWISTEMAESTNTPPSTQEEKVIAALWAEVIGIEHESISREDDFFKLGGDSLGVMRLTTKAHRLGLVLKSNDVFRNSKLASLAEKISWESIGPSEIAPYKPYSLVPEISDIDAFTANHIVPSLNIEANQVEDILPANGFQVDYIHNKEEPLGLRYAYLDIGPDVQWQRLIQACRTMLQGYECFRARFILYKGRYYQIILRDAPFIIEEISATQQIAIFSQQLCRADLHAASLSDVFSKMTLVNVGINRRRVILRLSHMQHDGWCTTQLLNAVAAAFNSLEIEKTPKWTSVLHYRHLMVEESCRYWRTKLQGATQITPSLVYKPGGSKVRTLRSYALSNFHASDDNRRTRPTVVVNVAWALILEQLAGHQDVVFGNVTTGRNGNMPGLDSVVGPCVNMLPMRLQLQSHSTTNREHKLRDLVEASAQQVDDGAFHNGLDWDELIDKCTTCVSGSRYKSAVHFRNMEFEPELSLGGDRVVVQWYELVETPRWTTVLVYPEENVLRLWLLADPAQIGDDGADEILHMLAGYCEEIVQSLQT
ncbi:nonribosomal peptide synthase, putative [Talaromyces islandicus]|uniref:Cyclochlorotine synthetase n=1 Tax=Talaromyces islandicus TaxID=28573 RepID=CCTN_TALIS|nr:RecName: Full=Cyclochlorotine synthetase; AltName: Full=Cyclochlorotine biosynthesis protein N; AltName: Full=Nonribosomal peptide synthetase cctN; Short=NRPS cctN [Talaromyces islandicus]CRG85572.1 nonribosomal peptide synthase, putative [Talaromyces islandicus]